MSRYTDPTAKKQMAYFTPQEHREIKTECATLGKSFTDYVIWLRDEGKRLALARVKKAGKK